MAQRMPSFAVFGVHAARVALEAGQWLGSTHFVRRAGRHSLDGRGWLNGGRTLKAAACLCLSLNGMMIRLAEVRLGGDQVQQACRLLATFALAGGGAWLAGLPEG